MVVLFVLEVLVTTSFFNGTCWRFNCRFFSYASVQRLSQLTFVFSFLNDPAPPEIYPLSLPDALPIWWGVYMFMAKNRGPAGLSPQPPHQPIRPVQPVLARSIQSGPASLIITSFTSRWCSTGNGSRLRYSRCRKATCSSAEMARSPSTQNGASPVASALP